MHLNEKSTLINRIFFVISKSGADLLVGNGAVIMQKMQRIYSTAPHSAGSQYKFLQRVTCRNKSL